MRRVTSQDTPAEQSSTAGQSDETPPAAAERPRAQASLSSLAALPERRPNAESSSTPAPRLALPARSPLVPLFFVDESSKSSSSAALEVGLRQWVGMSANPEMTHHRIIAEQRMLNAFKSNEGNLVLNDLKLGELPDIFDHPYAVARLTEVNISRCGLSKLPASLLRNINLQHLDVTRCPALRELPEFGHMPRLLTLQLRDNSLIRLPESIGRLVNLERLSVDNNRLETLPDSLGRLTRLGKLNVAYNRIIRLPNGMAGLSSLKSLNVSTNPLQNLPDDLGKLTLNKLNADDTDLPELPPAILAMGTLQQLRLHQNSMTTLPAGIARLQSLLLLDVSHGRLTSLPEEIVELPEDCVVNVSGNPLSQNIINNLQQLHAGGGPEIHFSVDDGEPENHATQPLEVNVARWLKDLTPEQLQLWQQLGNDSQAGHFNTWLELMEQTADFKNEQTRGRLEERLRSLLMALTGRLEIPGDTQVPVYLGIAEEATSTCRDRIAVGLNNMELTQINLRSDRGELSTSQLMTLGREMFIYDQIALIAAEKVKGLRMVDEVEVHLAFQVGLKPRLGLSLGNEDMLYRACSQVQDEDLHRASLHIQRRLNEPGLLRNFLAAWEPMRQFVRQRHATEWNTIQASFERSQELAYGRDDNPDWETLARLGPEWERALHDLCARKVDELMDTDLPSSSRQQEEPSASKRSRIE